MFDPSKIHRQIDPPNLTHHIPNHVTFVTHCLKFLGLTVSSSSKVKVPEDVPPARVYCLELSSLVKGIIFANFSPLSLSKGILLTLLVSTRVCFLAISVKVLSNFGNSC